MSFSRLTIWRSVPGCTVSNSSFRGVIFGVLGPPYQSHDRVSPAEHGAGQPGSLKLPFQYWWIGIWLRHFVHAWIARSGQPMRGVRPPHQPPARPPGVPSGLFIDRRHLLLQSRVNSQPFLGFPPGIEFLFFRPGLFDFGLNFNRQSLFLFPLKS
jgi:hypothetical protein